MRENKYHIFVSVIEIYLFSSCLFGGTYGGGSGTSIAPYLVATASHLQTLGATPSDWNSCFKMINDVSLASYTGTSFNIIGNSTTPFSGIFDGDGHLICDFKYSTYTSYQNIGIFGFVRGTIKNVISANPTINCPNSSYVGGLVGTFDRGYEVMGCASVNGSIIGKYAVGGLIGFSNTYLSFIPRTVNSYSTCSVNGETYVGGLVGRNSGFIDQCYSTGAVQGISNVGGLAGSSLGNYSQVTTSYWDVDTSGMSTSHGGLGRTTVQMKTESTYIGWSCQGRWKIDEGQDYPRFVWEDSSGQPMLNSVYWQGSGTIADPYLINDADAVYALGYAPCQWDKHFKVTKDIDLSGDPRKFGCIGTDIQPFSGAFCGEGHIITGYVYDSYPDDYNYGWEFPVGFFGIIQGPNTIVENLHLMNVNIDPVRRESHYHKTGGLAGVLNEGIVRDCSVIGGQVKSGGSNCGGLIATTEDAAIINCHTNVSLTAGISSCGGLVAYSDSIIQDCSAAGSVSTNQNWSGGLVGTNYGSISRSFATGNVNNTTAVCGGLVGENRGVIEQCFAEGDVQAKSNIGGLIGKNYGTVVNCYSNGRVNSTIPASAGGLLGYNSSPHVRYCYAAATFTNTSGSNVGGLVGENTYYFIWNSYWDKQVSGISTSVCGKGLTTAEMKQMISFKGFACDGVWTIDEGADYPHLAWENKPGEIIRKVWYAGGSGEDFDPYLIANPGQFCLIGNIYCDRDKHFKLISDIDMDTPEANQFRPIEGFYGVLDGNTHIVSNYNSTEGAIFIEIENATISNLILESPDVTNAVSPFVEVMNGGVVSNCIVLNGSLNTTQSGALLVGYNDNGLITDCAAEGTVVSTNSQSTSPSYSYGVGALVAENLGYVRRCYSAGSVTANYSYAGGLVGKNSATIENSYSSVNVQGCNFSGGLVGLNSACILNCYSIGIPASHCAGTVGGLAAASAGEAFVRDSYWDTSVTGVTTSAGGIGLSTTEMKEKDTYFSWGGLVWKINDQVDYPRLYWEAAAGDPIEKLPYAGGTGTLEDPYQIASAVQLYYLSMYYDDWNKHIELINDIDFSALSNPNACLLGYKQLPFAGVLDGNGFSVINLNLTETDKIYAGFFRYVDGEQARISNLTIQSPNLTFENCTNVGTLIGYLKRGVIDNCHIIGGSLTRTTNTGPVGGLIGYNYSSGVVRNSSSSIAMNITGGGGLVSANNGTIENCWSACDISATYEAGGLVGGNSGQISSSYFIGNVTSTGSYVGAVAAKNYGSIRNCYAQGAVSGDRYVGGLVGYSNDSTSTLLYHSYAACQVTGNFYLGGVVGKKYSSIIDRCYWDTDVCEIQVDEGATGLPTDQMQQASSFEGWGCDPGWMINETNDYPHLTWEGTTGVPITTEAYSGGCGTETNPFQISTAEQLNTISLNWGDYDKYFELNNDIDMSVIEPGLFNSIGNNSNHRFSGNLNGNGFSIRNFTPGNSSHGMFFYTDEAVMSNLTFIDHNIVSESSVVGTLCGYFIDSIADNIKVTGGAVHGGSTTGGLFGQVQKIDGTSIVKNCWSECTIEGSSYVGGIAGVNYGALLENCFSNSDLNVISYSGGGIVGYLRSNGGVISGCISLSNIKNLNSVNGGAGGIAGYVIDDVLIEKSCSKGTIEGSKRAGGLIGYVGSGDLRVKDSYSRCSVSGTESVGGLVGHFYDGYSSQLYYFDNCYAACSLTGDVEVGNFIGSGHSTTIINSCFYDSSINPGLTGYGDRADPAGLAGLTTGQLQMYNTFFNQGWDMDSEPDNGTEDIWTVCEGMNYPRFVWQIPAGDFACPDGVEMNDFNILSDCWRSRSEILSDATGDYYVNIEDIAVLSQFWLSANCGDCGGADITGDGEVNISDLNYLIEFWLEFARLECQIADMTGDGIVDADDFMLFCENWLIGID